MIPRITWIAKRDVDAWSNPTEPTKYPDWYTAFIPKDDYDRLITAQAIDHACAQSMVSEVEKLRAEVKKLRAENERMMYLDYWHDRYKIAIQERDEARTHLTNITKENSVTEFEAFVQCARIYIGKLTQK